MFITTALLALLSSQAQAFQATPFGVTRSAASSVVFSSSTDTAAKTSGGVAEELGIPCEDECALASYPNLPESVHPGVLSGQAMVDLLQDAKKKGAFYNVNYFSMAIPMSLVRLLRVD